MALIRIEATIVTHRYLVNARSVFFFWSAAKNLEDIEVHIDLEEKPVEFLDKCEALSYVWGERERQHDTYCKDQVIRGTANLLAALRRLQPKEGKRVLWINAICINQEDLAERLQQVRLMAEIYRTASKVLVWIAEEKSYTKAAFEELYRMSRAPRTRDHNQEFDEYLNALARTPIWEAMFDLWENRLYWTSLWIVQELAMSKDADVVCGSHSVPWDVFSNVAERLVSKNIMQQLGGTPECLYSRKSDREIVNITYIVLVSRGLYDSTRTFSDVLHNLRSFDCQDPKDRVFGALGLLRPTTAGLLSSLTYDVTNDRFLEQASILLAPDGLDFWFTRGVAPTMPSTRASWAMSFDGLMSGDTGILLSGDPGSDRLHLEMNFVPTRPYSDGPTLIVQCIVLGSVTIVSTNLTYDDLEAELRALVSIFYLNFPEDPSSREKISDSLFQVFLGFPEEIVSNTMDVLKMWLCDDGPEYSSWR